MTSFALLLIACLSRVFRVWKKLDVGLVTGALELDDCPGLFDLNPANKDSDGALVEAWSEIVDAVPSCDGDDDVRECCDIDRLLTDASDSSSAGAVRGVSGSGPSETTDDVVLGFVASRGLPDRPLGGVPGIDSGSGGLEEASSPSRDPPNQVRRRVEEEPVDEELAIVGARG